MASVVVDNKEKAKKELWRLLAKKKNSRHAESWSPDQMHLGQEKYKGKKRERKDQKIYISRFKFSWDCGKQQQHIIFPSDSISSYSIYVVNAANHISVHK